MEQARPKKHTCKGNNNAGQKHKAGQAGQASSLRWSKMLVPRGLTPCCSRRAGQLPFEGRTLIDAESRHQAGEQQLRAVVHALELCTCKLYMQVVPAKAQSTPLLRPQTPRLYCGCATARRWMPHRQRCPLRRAKHAGVAASLSCRLLGHLQPVRALLLRPADSV